MSDLMRLESRDARDRELAVKQLRTRARTAERQPLGRQQVVISPELALWIADQLEKVDAA